MCAISVAAARFQRLIVIDAATTLGPLVGGAPVARRDGLAGFTRRATRGARGRGGGGRRGTFGDRLDDLRLRRPGVPRSRRCGALCRSAAAGGGGGGFGGPARTLDGGPAAGGARGGRKGVCP